jgi:thiol-disulfide isomerase/thioredoxin
MFQGGTMPFDVQQDALCRIRLRRAFARFNGRVPLRFVRLRLLVPFLLFLLSTGAAQASLPSEYQTLRIAAPFGFKERVFDLTPALEAGRQQGKPLFIYFGAERCPPCADYAIFLARNAGQMRPALGRVVFVEITTSLSGPPVKFFIHGKKLGFSEFKVYIGDGNPGFTYPRFWMLTPEGHQQVQLPLDIAHYVNVDRHVRLLDQPPMK